jgi:hypothetical protein
VTERALRSADVFVGIGDYLTKNPDRPGEDGQGLPVQAHVARERVDARPEGQRGAAGARAKPDCTLELSDEDFMAMVSGKANPMKLFSSGKLKIGGDLMASQKLDFLKKIDKAAVAAAIAEAQARRAPPPRPRSPLPPRREGAEGPEEGVRGLSERLAKNPALVGELGAKVQFTITGLDRALGGRRRGGDRRQGHRRGPTPCSSSRTTTSRPLWRAPPRRKALLHARQAAGGRRFAPRARLEPPQPELA